MRSRVQAVARGAPLNQTDYRSLAAFRFALRRFMHFSAAAAQDAGLTSSQHQALLSVKGHCGDRAISVGELADHLVVAPHTAAELVMRLDEAGLLEKRTDPDDHRRIGLHLTRKAEQILRRLSDIHLKEISEIAPDLIGTLEALLAARDRPPRQRAGGDG